MVTACAAIASDRTNAAARIILPSVCCVTAIAFRCTSGANVVGRECGGCRGDGSRRSIRPILPRATDRGRKQHALTLIALASLLFFHLTQKDTPPTPPLHRGGGLAVDLREVGSYLSRPLGTRMVITPILTLLCLLGPLEKREEVPLLPLLYGTACLGEAGIPIPRAFSFFLGVRFSQG